MYNEEDYLQLSGIQHFSYCRRRWALIHIEEQWAENHLTAEGRLFHERVHDNSIIDYRFGIITMRDLAIKSSSLGTSGKCDAVEFHPSDEGIELKGRKGKWSVRPVEYKHGSPQINDSDRLQLTAQVMCLEEMFCVEINEADLFYYAIRRREKVAITDELRQTVIKLFKEMHELYERGYTPKVMPKSKCRQCSLVDICNPKLMKTTSVASYMRNAFTMLDEE